LSAQWKIVQVLFTLKPGKPPNELTSYRPISLSSSVSKDCDELLLKGCSKWLNNGFIPDHQFGFRGRHSTTEQTHGTVQNTSKTLGSKVYFSAAFLDAFSSVRQSTAH
jgi:hypothetical protein